MNIAQAILKVARNKEAMNIILRNTYKQCSFSGLKDSEKIDVIHVFNDNSAIGKLSDGQVFEVMHDCLIQKMNNKVVPDWKKLNNNVGCK